MNELDLALTTALKQAKLIRHREVSPLELLEIYLKGIQVKRIQALNLQ